MFTTKKYTMQLKDFNSKTKYTFIGSVPLMTPNGVVTRKYKHAHTGTEWRKILVYDFDGFSTPFKKMFKKVASKKKSKK